MRPRGVAATMILLAALIALAPAGLGVDTNPRPVPEEEAPACPEQAEVQDLGMACRTNQGLLEVFASDGRSLGTTHGTDPVPDPPLEPEVTSTTSTAGPTCIDDPYQTGETGIVVIYARAHDDADRHASLVDDIRTLVDEANALVSDAAQATGAAGAELTVACSQDQVRVEEAVLPTDKADASFSTITEDLQDQGYDAGTVKHWVFYDDRGACGCGGTGHLYFDDRMASWNANNGNADPMFAVNFGYEWSTRTWLHELGHNLGAVQDSAPHTTGAGHCTDGLDIMCYDDGGPNGAEYTSGACSTEVWDCGKDDYFDADPALGSYLDTHWNIAAPFNGFLDLLYATQVELLDPRPATIYAGCDHDAPLHDPFLPLYAGEGCVRLTASSPSGITQVDVYHQGTHVASATAPVEDDVYEIAWPLEERSTGVVRATVTAGDGETVHVWESAYSVR